LEYFDHFESKDESSSKKEKNQKSTKKIKIHPKQMFTKNFKTPKYFGSIFKAS
jgi:hypothetical protein